MAFEKNGIAAAGACETGCPHHKHTPRDEQAIRLLQNRLNRMIGQLNGIKNMVEDVESALQSFGYIILQDHLETCVVEEIRNGNPQIVDEAVELMKKLK